MSDFPRPAGVDGPTEAVAVRGLDVQALLSQAVEKGGSIETLERLFALAKDVRAEQARAAWHEAMAAFQSDVPVVRKTKTARVKTSSGSEYTYDYAPLEALISANRPTLAENGLSATFKTASAIGSVTAICVVAHSLGHFEESEFTVPVDLNSKMNPAQQVASALTYAKRGAYQAALGLAPEDDDDGAAAGEERSRRAPEPQAPRPPSARPFPPPPVNPGAQTWSGRLEGFDEAKGFKKNGQPWTRYDIVCEGGKKLSTFKTDLLAKAKPFIHSGEPVAIAYEVEQKGKFTNTNILSISPLHPPEREAWDEPEDDPFSD